ncbi:hypothetical protein C8Q72DRAFT_934282 [Fomitopsis betulina]|nr:hypothetical protein C8Q72DRAFT_934282 [Fomitopsis betulina]
MGKANVWVEVDLLQEHLNFWIKTIYKVHGSSASWEWLVMISPCVDVLRCLAASMNSTLGAQQGTKHTTPSLERDIAHLRASLQHFRVYVVIPGREIDDGSDNPVVPDSLTLGLQHLGEPLKEFNTVFTKLQAHCRAPPLLGHKYLRDNIVAPSASASALQAIVLPLDDPQPVASHKSDANDDAESSKEEELDTELDVKDDVENDLVLQQVMSLDNAGDVSLDMDDLSADDFGLYF